MSLLGGSLRKVLQFVDSPQVQPHEFMNTGHTPPY